VFYTARDGLGRSHIGVVDLSPHDDFKVIEIGHDPVLSPGELGLFDDSGVAVGSVVHRNGVEHLYYMGWNLRQTVPWANSIGLATRERTGNSFNRSGRVPVLDRSEEDPYSLSYPWVVADDDSMTMWYGTNKAWGSSPEDMQHVIRRASSVDGREWHRDSKPCIDFVHDGEYALSRPTVRSTSTGFEMFYSYRSHVWPTTYRLGWAVSDDGLAWERCDSAVGLEPSEDDWDSEMLCYPCVFEWSGATWLLYNGNGYGRTGFGLARRVGGND
jgi:hypothetical protein